MKLNRGTIPPGGFHFSITESVTLKAATHSGLVKEIETWRTQNGIPIGDPERDIDNYFCAKWPHFCVAETHETASKPGESITKRVNGWAAIMLRSTPQRGYALVNQDEAESRCETCLACPFNKAWRGQCGNCERATDTILIRLRQLRKIALDDGLLGCSINGFDNKTAIHFTTDDLKLTSEQKAKLPQNCWIHKTQQ